MDKKVKKNFAVQFSINCKSAKEINSKVKELIETGISKDDALDIVKTAKEIRNNRLSLIKSQIVGLKYDGSKTLSAIFEKEYNGKDWKEIAKKNTNLCKVETLESFLLAYYPYLCENGSIVITAKDKQTKETTTKERDLHKVNAQIIWNRCIDNVLRETNGKEMIRKCFAVSEIVTLEMQEKARQEKKQAKK